MQTIYDNGIRITQVRLEQRYYYCQNWHTDVSAIVNASSKMMEWVNYSSYGVLIGLPAGD